MKVFTDGACSGNPGPGGYAVVVEPAVPGDEIKQWCCGRKDDTTNNEMELLAVIEALMVAPWLMNNVPAPKQLTIMSDSLWVIKGATKEWKVKTHVDHWKQFWNMMDVCKEDQIDVTFQWVKGHNGNKLNELADELAKASIHTYIPSTI